jgi:ketosteroid isomerase-like protein
MIGHREKKQGSSVVLCCCFILLLFTVACQQAPPDTREADAGAIKDTEAQWAKAAAAKNADETVSYYADDASMLAPNMPIVSGKQAIRGVWGQLMANPGFSISWASSKAEASRSGDLGYDLGTYQLTMNDPQGKQISDHGKYMVVLEKAGRRQVEGGRRHVQF